MDTPPPGLLAPLPSIEHYSARYIDGLDMPESLREAVRYALLAGGKRLRPILAWWSCIAVGGTGEQSLPGGVAVEFIHAFSLVHDDLPALDNDDFRRGKPTLHRHAGEAMAILAGDAMLTMAFQLISDRIGGPRASSGNNGAGLELAARLTAELALGTSGMINGQVYDTLGGMPATLDDAQRLVLIHKNKTGALIRAACRMGALCGLAARRSHGAASSSPGTPAQLDPDAALLAITRYAESVGLMFQVVDDILDVTQTAEHVGKKTNKDVDAGKLTYPGALGLDRSRAEVRRLLDEALAATQQLGPAAAPLAELARYLAVRTK